jgi:hypothetical protein
MLRWVSDAAFDRTSPTFSRVSVADDVEAVMLATGEGAEFVPLSIETRGGARYVSAVEPGLLIGIQPGSKSILGAVNFLDPEESQLFTADAIEVSSPRLSSLSGDSAELLGSRSLIEWCALAALLLFLLDLLWWVAVSVVRFKQSRSQHAT